MHLYRPPARPACLLLSPVAPKMVPDSPVQANMTLQQFPVKAVQSYGDVEFARLDRKLAMFRALSPVDQALLPEFETRISRLAECVEANANLLKLMAESAESIHTMQSSGRTNGTGTEVEGEEEERQMLSREVRRGFTLLAKDWGATGARERERVYGPLVEAVEEAYDEATRANRTLERDQFRVLVPGAGAGRLAWELVSKGFAVEGCEASFTALLVGNFALNSTGGEGRHLFYPFVHEHSNVKGAEMGMRGVEIPDVDPMGVPKGVEFAMRGGDFVEAYEGQDGKWDAVCSCLAFDLGEGGIGFVRRVAQVVKAGGVWAFVGPMPCLEGGSGEGMHLSVEEVMGMVRKSGFKIVRREEMAVLHSGDAESMRRIVLKVPFVVAVKVRPTA